MLAGFNHITLAVTDVGCSFDFYVNTLGLKPRARWKQGAYLSLDGLWLCLSLDNTSLDSAQSAGDYTHYAFTVSAEDLPDWQAKLAKAGAPIWKQNSSEGDSLYFLDPDGHKLELHCGSLESRLTSIAVEPYEELQLYD